MSESLTSNTISVAIESEDTTSIDVSGLIIKGDDGFSPTIDITQLESGVRITATDKDKTSVGEVTVSKENVIGALGYTPADEDVLSTKVDKVTGKSLSTEDFTSTYKEKLDSIEDNAEVNVQSDWNISDTTSDAFIKNKPNIYLKSETDTLLNNKVDKVTGKSLISDSEITRLSTVSNYDDTGVKSSIDAINTNINTINNQIAQIQKITFSLNSDNDIEAIIQI